MKPKKTTLKKTLSCTEVTNRYKQRIFYLKSRWSNNEVPYSFDPHWVLRFYVMIDSIMWRRFTWLEKPTELERALIQQAMNEWESVCNIRFVESPSRLFEPSMSFLTFKQPLPTRSGGDAWGQSRTEDQGSEIIRSQITLLNLESVYSHLQPVMTLWQQAMAEHYGKGNEKVKRTKLSLKQISMEFGNFSGGLNGLRDALKHQLKHLKLQVKKLVDLRPFDPVPGYVSIVLHEIGHSLMQVFLESTEDHIPTEIDGIPSISAVRVPTW